MRLLTTDGVTVSATGHTAARRSRPKRNNNYKAGAQRAQAKAALARKWFHDGIEAAELAWLAGASVEHARRIVGEQLSQEGNPGCQGANAPIGTTATPSGRRYP